MQEISGTAKYVDLNEAFQRLIDEYEAKRKAEERALADLSRLITAMNSAPGGHRNSSDCHG
jgi:hypothetical protein